MQVINVYYNFPVLELFIEFNFFLNFPLFQFCCFHQPFLMRYVPSIPIDSVIANYCNETKNVLFEKN